MVKYFDQIFCRKAGYKCKQFLLIDDQLLLERMFLWRILMTKYYNFKDTFNVQLKIHMDIVDHIMISEWTVYWYIMINMKTRMSQINDITRLCRNRNTEIHNISSIISRCKAYIMCIACIKFVYDMSNMKKNSKAFITFSKHKWKYYIAS